MKQVYTKFIKPYWFVVPAVLALMMPDYLLRYFMQDGVFSQGYVTLASSLFSLGWAFFFVFFCCLILPKKVGKIVYAFLTLVFSVLSLCECVYHKIFDQFFWLKGIGLAGEGADYLDYAVKLVDVEMILFFLAAIGLMVAALLNWKSYAVNFRKRALITLIPITVLLTTHICLEPVLHGDKTNQWDAWNNPRIVYKKFNDVNKSMEISGIYQFSYLNLYTAVFPKGHNLSKADRALVDEYFYQQGTPEENNYTDLLKGKNVIAVMMESMDTWMIDKKHTPTLYKMMHNGIQFTNYNAPFFGVGFTLSSEFAFNTGFFTPVSASSAANFSTNTFPYSLARLFKEAGYTTNSFHFNSPNFYNRGILHKTFGYEKYNAASDFGIVGVNAELDSNLIQNDAFYEKMVEQTPFFNFFITYSAHLPYTGNSPKLELALDNQQSPVKESAQPEIDNIRILAKDTDEFFRILLERLEEDGLLDDTVIVGYTDHFAYGISDELLEQYKGDTLSYCVPAFIYGKDVPAKEIKRPMMTIDWAPTLVNLFGLSDDARYLGHDALSSDGNALVYFETGAWMDETMHYIPSDEEQTVEDAVYIKKQTEKVEKMREINDFVVLGDYYKKK